MISNIAINSHFEQHASKLKNVDQDQGSHDSDSTCQERLCLDVESRHKMKVQLCRNFLENRVCPYQARCKFAHGLQQLLQNTELGQNFRTKKCKIFYDKKYCRFGQRCNFKHCQKQKQFKRFSRCINIINQHPECFLGYRNKTLLITQQKENSSL